jgi:hypothetical protein
MFLGRPFNGFCFRSMASAPAPVGFLDLLAAFIAAVFIVSGLLVVSPWPLRLACLAGSVIGLGAGWRITRERPWEAKLLAQPLGALLGFAAGGLLWVFSDALPLLS